MASENPMQFEKPGEPKNEPDLSDPTKTLILQSDQLARAWFHAVRYSGYVSMSFQEFFELIRLLSRQVFGFLSEERSESEFSSRFDPGDIGQRLADLHFLRPEAFHATLTVIKDTVISILERSHLSDTQVLQLTQRLSWLLVEIARGYYAAAVELVQKEQEQILRAVKLALEEAQAEQIILEERNDLLIHSLPDLMFIFDHHGNYLDYYTNNPEQLSMPVEQFLHKNVREVLDEPDAEKILQMIQLCHESGETKDYVFSFKAAMGVEYREIRFIPYATEQVLCVVRNVTRQKKAEEMLIANEARYRAVVEDQTELICRWNTDGVLTFANQAFFRYFDLSREEILNQVFLPPVVGEDQVRGGIFLFWLRQCSSQKPTLTIEHRTVLSNGGIHWLEWNMRTISGGEGRRVEIQAVGRDITKLRDFQERIEQANSLLRLLNQQLITTQEQERQTIALNLHDLVLNQLGGIIATTETSISAAELEKRLEALIGQLREMISDLRPPMLNYGLYTGILGLFDEIRDRSDNKIETELQVSPTSERLDPDLELHLFRILHQACHNTLQHANAHWLSISGSITQDRVDLVVMDDGPGFSFGQFPDLPELLAQYHFGLAGMVERAMMIGAEVHFANRIDPDGNIIGAQVFIQWQRKNAIYERSSLYDTAQDLPETLGLLEQRPLERDRANDAEEPDQAGGEERKK